LELDLGYQDRPCQVLLNYQAERSGCIRAEVMGLDGYGVDDCVPLEGDSLCSPLAWRESSIIAPIHGGSMRVRLHLDRATVYSYGLQRA